jgi:hypothetical protein
MVFRPKHNAQPAAPPPEWRQRFDAAEQIIRSKRPPEWVDDRLIDLEQALLAAHDDIERLTRSIGRLDPERVSRELKHALRNEQRRLPTDADRGDDKQVALLRQRYAAVNEMMNQRRATQRRVADVVADLEMLALEAERDDIGLSVATHALDEHLQRLDIDLRALSMARDELRSW